MRGQGFTNIQEIYEPNGTGMPNVVKAPGDMVAWFLRHPNLQTGEPELSLDVDGFRARSTEKSRSRRYEERGPGHQHRPPGVAPYAPARALSRALLLAGIIVTASSNPSTVP